MKLSFLSREQQFKKCMIQVSNKYKVPYDIIKLIYNYKRKNEINICNDIRLFYTNIIFWLTTECGVRRVKYANNGLTLNTSYVGDTCEYIGRDSWVWNLLPSEKRFNVYLNRVPDNRGVEWAIKHSYLKKRNNYDEFYEVRSKLIYEINIIGESNYLMDKPITVNGTIYWTPCNIRKKIKYLNTSSWDEIMCDYEIYLDHKGYYGENDWRLIVDNWGDSCYM